MNFNIFPFQKIELYNENEKLYILIDQFGLFLRSTYSMLNSIALKTFLTSDIKKNLT